MGKLRNKIAVALAAALWTLPAGAVDTEIFFGGATSGAEVIRPNVLFILDTSGSMTSTVSGTGKSRMENMKDAMHTILDSVSNINVGLMRFHSRDNDSTDGGPIAFPIAYVDGDACDYESCESSLTTDIQVQVESSADDAEETSIGTMLLDSEELELIADPSLATGEQTIERYVQARTDDAEANPNSIYDTADDDLDIGDYTVIFRFPELDIPANASVTAAEIELTAYGSSNNSPTTNIRVELPSDGDANPFYYNEYVAGRSWWSTSVAWNPIPILPVGTRFQTPDLSTLVEEAVKSSHNWSSGNAMAFHFSDNNQGLREVASYRVGEADYWDDPTVRPLLRVTYSSGAGLADTRQTVGLRFQDVGVPQGAKITGAYLEFTAAESGSDTLNLAIQGEKLDAADANYTDGSPDFSYETLTTRRTAHGTIANVAWSGVESWSGDSVYQSPDISSVVQELVDQTSWCGGKSMAFFVSGSDVTHRAAYAYDGSPGAAPRLRVTFEEPTGGWTAGQGCLRQTTVKQVATGSDDAEETVSTGGITLGSSDLELVHDGSTKQIIGTRFQQVPIPKGATILSAELRFEVDEAMSGDLSLLISGEDVDDASSFSSSTSNLSGRTKTSASVTWTNPPEAAVNENLTSPDISAIVQEIVSRDSWARNNDMAFLIEQGSGTNRRTVESFEGEASAAPTFEVRYQWNLGDQTGPEVTVRQRLKSTVDEYVADGYTPIVETLYEAVRYYRGDAVRFGRSRGFGPSTSLPSGTGSGAENTRLSHPSSYTGGTVVRPSGCTADYPNDTDCRKEYISGSPVYKSPISESCQANYAVLLTDGEPNSFDEESEIESLIGNVCTGSGGARCANQLASFMFTQDQSADLENVPDIQKVRLYTIGFDLPSATFLSDMATAGGGSFFEASDAASLTSVFQAILAEILEKNTTYTSPTITVNTFNRLTHREELYFALFRPSADTKWVGNVKRYKLGGSGADRSIVDQNEVGAIDDSTGFFKTTASSFWTAGADAPDGDDVGVGGAAGELTTSRNVYTYTSASAPSSVDLTVAAHALHEDNTLLTKALLDISDETDTYRSNLIKWARGIDVLDRDNDGSITDARREIGDPLHSKPALVTYGGTEESPDITLYLITNEGYLHAINTSDGSELFSFVPKELLSNLNEFYVDSGSGSHPYGLDGPLTTWVYDADLDGQIIDAEGNVESGEHAYLYFGMRRGGRNYYSVDVTDRDHPTLRWAIAGGSGEFSELGQTWSAPLVAKIKLNGVEKRVLIFGGGYDSDQDNYSVRTADSEGRTVYMIDASTGAKIWQAGPAGSGNASTDPAGDPNLVLSDMIYSIPSDIKAIDLDFDGYVDRLYVGDMGGQVWLFDIDNENNTGASNLVTGGVFASLGGSTAEENRRFYYPPDVSLVEDDDTTFLAVALGSGYRAHPLNVTIRDRFYMVRDTYLGTSDDVYVTQTVDWNSHTAITENDLYDATSNTLQSAGSSVENLQAEVDDLQAELDAMGESDPGYSTKAAELAAKQSELDEAVAALAAERQALDDADGWFIQLKKSDGSWEGEKVLASSTTFSNKLIFTTWKPTQEVIDNSCAAREGTATAYVVSIIDATATENFNEDPQLERSKVLKRGGLAPEPVVLLPPPEGDPPVVLIGPEQLEVDLSNPAKKTYWLEVQ